MRLSKVSVPGLTPEETLDGQPIATDHLVRRRETRQRKRHEPLFNDLTSEDWDQRTPRSVPTPTST